ncbi:MAG: ribosome recycling factor [Parachlamydiales bacterium]
MGIQDQTKKEMTQALTHLETDLKGIRTGRANPSLLDSVTAEVYGSQMRLRDVANVTAPEAQQLLVTPFDAHNTNTIGKAIERANLGMQVVIEGNLIRILVPPMDKAVRQEMVKQCKRKGEEAKVSIRNIRRKYNDLVRKQKADGEITEDVVKREEKGIQTLTDDFCAKADALTAAKEKEVMVI